MREFNENPSRNNPFSGVNPPPLPVIVIGFRLNVLAPVLIKLFWAPSTWNLKLSAAQKINLLFLVSVSLMGQKYPVMVAVNIHMARAPKVLGLTWLDTLNTSVN